MGKGKFKGKPTSRRQFSTPKEMIAGTSARPRTFRLEVEKVEEEEEIESREESEEELEARPNHLRHCRLLRKPKPILTDLAEQTSIDNFMVQELDGTVNEWGWCKQKLGANAILAVSLAICKAGASVKKIPLYKIYNMIDL